VKGIQLQILKNTSEKNYIFEHLKSNSNYYHNPIALKIIYSFVFLTGLLASCQDPSRKETSFSNPILAGFYPDPSICRVGDDYYLVNSSFSFFPGIPIFHSTDLVQWNQIGNVLDRPEQLNLNGLEISQGIYAPTIRFNNGVFYVICTVVGGIGNFVVTAANPAGPWSVPAALPHVQGMDPDIFFDTDGKAYIASCWPAPDDKPLYQGHRSIRLVEFFPETQTTSPTEKLLVNGGSDISKKPIWIEGPHLYKIEDFYYLMCAEGGTSIDHSEVVFRSKNVNGPYVPFEKNPILTQRHLSPSRKNPITNTGHADLVQTKEGEWYAVFLACRPYVENYFNTGRETFMTPVSWENGWPVINQGNEEVQYKYLIPETGHVTDSPIPFNGNFTIRENFTNTKLDPYWLFIRTPSGDKYSIGSQQGGLILKLAPETLNQKSNPAFVGRRQQHLQFEASAALAFQPQNQNEVAGLSAFQNEEHYYLLAKTKIDNKEAVVLYKCGSAGDVITPEVLGIKYPDPHETLFLKIVGNKGSYSFYYAATENQWETVSENLDGKYLSTEIAGGFIGTIIGMHASASGTTSSNTAGFHWFEYTGNDETFAQ
jgi:xylan 1,4-beta-xylosidase